VIPYHFVRDLQRGRGATLQVLFNATNTNNSAIGQGYIKAIILEYNRTITAEGLHADFRRIAPPDVAPRGLALSRRALVYTPVLVDSWFVVAGVLGLVLILNGSIVAAGARVKEEELGTLEQLLMSPANTSEIIIAKITPLFVLLFLMALVEIGI